MDQYVGLDVSLKETSISVRKNRKRVWRGKCLSDPQVVVEAIRKHAPDAVLIVFETGPSQLGFTANSPPKVSRRCASTQGMRRRHSPLRRTRPSPTMPTGWLFLAPAGFFREVRVKSWAAMRVRALIGGRVQLVGISTELSNHIRGVMKTFGLIVPKGGGRIFETHVRTLLAGQEALAAIVLPLLETWRTLRAQAARLDRQLTAVARASAPCRLMMTAPGIGPLTALSYTSMIEDPANFKNSRAVGAYTGLVARGYQSGEIDYDGHMRSAATNASARCFTKRRYWC